MLCTQTDLFEARALDYRCKAFCRISLIADRQPITNLLRVLSVTQCPGMKSIVIHEPAGALESWAPWLLQSPLPTVPSVLYPLVQTTPNSCCLRGISTGFGGPPACWLIKEHFSRFVVGSDPRDTNRIWDQLFRASMFYGRKGITLAAISVVDLAIWDLLGKLRDEPVYVCVALLRNRGILLTYV